MAAPATLSGLPVREYIFTIVDPADPKDINDRPGIVALEPAANPGGGYGEHRGCGPRWGGRRMPRWAAHSRRTHNMPTQAQVASGLGGAIGCDFRQAQNQLVFVEFDGKLSLLNLFRTATAVSSGTATLKGTFLFDFDSGTESVAGDPFGPPFDVFWEQQTAV